ncbi:MAG: hypothetical protein LBT15_06995, partial [Synergistaceae bacterium]|nr:hypothetical protein [Synergistaceae bacterium]
NAFLKSLRALTDGVFAVLNEGGIPEAPDAREVLNLEHLYAAWIEMDMETVNDLLVQYTSLRLDPETKNAISGIEEDILMCEYEKALEKIESLI